MKVQSFPVMSLRQTQDGEAMILIVVAERRDYGVLRVLTAPTRIWESPLMCG